LTAYAFIIAAAALGYFNGPWWAAAACGTALALPGIVERQKLRARLAAVNATEALAAAGLASFANGLIVAGGGYAMGWTVAWLFTVSGS
jgi:hypothetical protein